MHPANGLRVLSPPHSPHLPLLGARKSEPVALSTSARSEASVGLCQCRRLPGIARASVSFKGVHTTLAPRSSEDACSKSRPLRLFTPMPSRHWDKVCLYCVCVCMGRVAGAGARWQELVRPWSHSKRRSLCRFWGKVQMWEPVQVLGQGTNVGACAGFGARYRCGSLCRFGARYRCGSLCRLRARYRCGSLCRFGAR